jgi:hypothetical protein
LDHYYEVEMGVAVTGGRKIGMITTGLYNCLGVAAIDRHGLKGGLYHYPSLCPDKDYVVLTLTRMLNHLSPGWVGITPAGKSYEGDKGSEASDIEWLQKIVRQLAPSTTIEVLPGKGRASLFWEGGQPKINELPSGALTAIPPQLSAMRNVITSKPQKGDAWAFGIDLEKEDVDGPAKKSVAKQIAAMFGF